MRKKCFFGSNVYPVAKGKHYQDYYPLIDLHLVFEKPRLKNQVGGTWFLSTSNLNFAGYAVRKIKFKLDFSKIKCRSIGCLTMTLYKVSPLVLKIIEVSTFFIHNILCAGCVLLCCVSPKYSKLLNYFLFLVLALTFSIIDILVTLTFCIIVILHHWHFATLTYCRFTF